jgi:hypothetical protein
METQPHNVLIAGGSGLVGTRLKALIEHKNFRVAFLSRKPQPGIKSFHWDPEKKIMDPESLRWAHTVINLAGENIAGGRWTVRRKRKIINSRIFASELLAESLRNQEHQVETMIQASAIGIYGDAGNKILHEDFPPGTDFLANTCVRWENAARKLNDTGIRTVILRIGLVLSDEGGVLSKLLIPMRLGVAPVPGNGTQYMSWIHIDDLCQLIAQTIKYKSYRGIYNAVAPGPVSNSNFMKLLSQVRGGGHLLLHIPKWLIRLFIGEKSVLITSGQRVSSEKVESSGFTFHYPSLGPALKDLTAKD